MADWSPDSATGQALEYAVREQTSSPARTQAFATTLHSIFALGSFLELIRGTDTVTIPLPLLQINGTTLTFPATTVTVNAAVAMDIDSGDWDARIKNGARFAITYDVGKTVGVVRVSDDIPAGTSTWTIGPIVWTTETIPALGDAGGGGGSCALQIIGAPATVAANGTFSYSVATEGGSTSGDTSDIVGSVASMLSDNQSANDSGTSRTVGSAAWINNEANMLVGNFVGLQAMDAIGGDITTNNGGVNTLVPWLWLDAYNNHNNTNNILENRHTYCWILDSRDDTWKKLFGPVPLGSGGSRWFPSNGLGDYDSTMPLLNRDAESGAGVRAFDPDYFANYAMEMWPEGFVSATNADLLQHAKAINCQTQVRVRSRSTSATDNRANAHYRFKLGWTFFNTNHTNFANRGATAGYGAGKTGNPHKHPELPAWDGAGNSFAGFGAEGGGNRWREVPFDVGNPDRWYLIAVSSVDSYWTGGYPPAYAAALSVPSYSASPWGKSPTYQLSTSEFNSNPPPIPDAIAEGCTQWQTWLVEASGGGTDGSGFLLAPTVVSPGNYTFNLSNQVPAGNYLLWAKCNDNGNCQDSFVTTPITITAAGGGGGGSTGSGTPPNITWTAGSPTTCTSTKWDQITQGTGSVVNDQWAVTSWGLDGTIVQTVCIGPSNTQSNSFRIYSKVPLNWPNPGGTASEVKSYPLCYWGQPPGFPSSGQSNIPIRVGNINHLWAGHKGVTVAVDNSFKGHLSHDMRLMDSAQVFANYNAAASSIWMELFVVDRTWRGYGAHPNGRAASRFRGQYTIGNIDWYVYIQPGASNTPQLIWMPVTLPCPVPFDMAPLFKWAAIVTYNQLQQGPGTIFARGQTANSTIINPDKIFVSNAMGVEVEEGEIDLTVSTAYFRCNLD